MSEVSRAGPDERHLRASGSLLSGAGLMLSSRAVVAVLAWTGTLMVARRLSPEAFGAYSFVFNLLGLLGMLADLETSRVVVREVVDTEDLERVVGRFFAFRIALSSVSYAVALLFVIVAGYEADIVRATAVAGLSYFAAAGFWALVTVCQAKLWLRVVAIAVVAAQVVQLAVTVVMLLAGVRSIVWLAVPFVVNDLIALVVALVVLRGRLRVRPRIDVGHWRRWLVEAAPLALGAAIATAYFRVDSVMLSKLDSTTAVGTYQIGYKFSDLLAFVAPAMIGVVLPLLVRAWPGDGPGFHRAWRQSFVLFLVVGGAATATFAVLAEPVIVSLYGSRYEAAVTPARVLVFGQALNLFSQLFFVALVAVGRRRSYLAVAVAGLVVNVSLNLVLIPAHGPQGAAWATVGTELVVLTAAALVIRDVPARPLPGRALAVVAAAMAAAAGVLWVLSGVVVWPVALVAALAVYAGVLHGLGVDGRGGLPALVANSRVVVGPSPQAEVG